MIFKPGDIVEVKFKPDHQLFKVWNGLIFEVIQVPNATIVFGKVIKTPPSFKFKYKYKIGDGINWSLPNVLHPISIDKLQELALEQQKQEKYYSPFTGKWT